MGKPSVSDAVGAHEAVSSSLSVRVSPRKIGLVAGLIRGLSVQKAILNLEFSKRRVAHDVKKCLLAAVANAEMKNLDVDRLYVKLIWVGKSMTLKRFRPRARGRGARILKKFSSLWIVVSERVGE